MSNRITPDDLPWDELRKWGITRERMEKTGNLDRLLYGGYTRPVTFFRTEGGQKIEGEAAVRVYRTSDQWKIEMQTRCERPSQNDRISVFGTALTDDQKRNLLDTGHAGAVTIKDGNGKESQVLVSLNPDTNRIVTFPMQFAALPKEGGVEGRICGVQMNEDQKSQFLKGEPVYLTGLKNSKGESFDACVQFSAYERRAVFTTPEWLREQQRREKDLQESNAQESSEKKGKSEGRKAKEKKVQEDVQQQAASRGMKH